MPRPRYRPGSIHEIRLCRGVDARSAAEYLASRLALPVRWAEELLVGDCVEVQTDRDGAARPLPPGRLRLARGAILTVRFPADWRRHLEPTVMPLDILYEDAYLLALDKPPGIVVHPARGHLDGNTLQNGVLHLYREAIGRPDTTIGPPHRLDKDTSGVVLFSRTRAVYTGLVRQFTGREIEKRYLAVTAGVPDESEFTVDEPLGVDPDDPSKAAVVPVAAGGREAVTDFQVCERGDGWSLVEARPRTGRAHQIRVHLAHLSCPVLGDRDYHPEPQRFPAVRHALHAEALALAHPVTGRRLELHAPLPPDLTELLAHLRTVAP